MEKNFNEFYEIDADSRLVNELDFFKMKLNRGFAAKIDGIINIDDLGTNQF